MFEFLKDKEKWQQIRTSKDYKPIRDILEKDYNQYCKNVEFPELPYTMWLSTIKTGIRKEYDRLYQLRRIQMTVYTSLCMIYPENDEYLDKLQNIVAKILEEYTWCLPIHIRPGEYNSQQQLDLYACETALYLEEIKFLLGDRLSDILAERISKTVRYRIFDSVRDISEFYENNKTNWAAVCTGSVAVAMMYEDPNLYYEMQPRLEKSINSYLSGIGDDGSVAEGPAYWSYGFRFFVLYADMLKRLTNGKVDKFKDPKVEKIAGFYSNLCMSNDCVYSYSDGTHELDFNIAMAYYLNEKYGTDVPEIQYGGLSTTELSIAIRSFLFYNPSVKAHGINNKTTYYDELKMYITRKDKYAFAIKAGDNAPGHSHNDIASFAMVTDNKQVLADLGAPLYTRHSLSEDGYKDVLEKTSLGHSVPIVNGKPQGLGKEFFGTMSVCDEKVVIDFKNAYEGNVEKLTRIVSFEEDRVILLDEFDKNIDITERFVTEFKPTITDKCIKVEKVNIILPENTKTSCKMQLTKHHSGEDREVYLIDVTPVKGCDSLKFEFTVDEGTRRNGSI